MLCSHFINNTQYILNVIYITCIMIFIMFLYIDNYNYIQKGVFYSLIDIIVNWLDAIILMKMT